MSEKKELDMFETITDDRGRRGLDQRWRLAWVWVPRRPTLPCAEGPGHRRVRRRSVPTAVRAGRVADLDAVQLGRCPGSRRHTGQRRLMTRKMHDVFIVVSEGSDGEHVARTVYAASEDDARQAYQENYADEPIVAVHQ